MNTSKHSIHPLVYILVAIGLLTGYAFLKLDNGGLTWLSYVIFAISGFGIFILYKTHRTITISSDHISIVYLNGEQIEIEKQKVAFYKKKSEYAGKGHTKFSFEFTMISGETHLVDTAMLKDEKGLNNQLDKFVSTLKMSF